MRRKREHHPDHSRQDHNAEENDLAVKGRGKGRPQSCADDDERQQGGSEKEVTDQVFGRVERGEFPGLSDFTVPLKGRSRAISENTPQE